MPEVIGAFLRGERIHQSANPAAEARNGPLSCFPEMGFEFAERLLDRIKVRRIFGKISQHCTGGFNQFSHAGNFVDGEAVHHHGVTALECRNKASFEIGHEGCCIHRAIKHEGRDHPAMAQACHEGDRLPMPVRNMVNQPNATRAAASKPHHGGVGGGLVNKHQSGRVKHALFSHPTPPCPGHVRSLLLRRPQAFLVAMTAHGPFPRSPRRG